MLKIQVLVRSLLPPALRKVLKQTYHFAQERLVEPTELILGLRDPLTPPKSKIFVGDGDFNAIGKEFRQYFIDFCQLKPDHTLLDVGCGIGRMAVPLTTYLSSTGMYEGFDPVKKGIDWCQEHITSHYPNFHFQHINVFNGSYNPTGQDQAINFRFPYDDEHVDVAIVVGVFTHMTINEISTYLGEIKRVLKPGGRCFTSFFLLNDASRQLMSGPTSTFNFQYEFEGRWSFDSQNPNNGSAHDEAELLHLFSEHGLQIDYPIRYGFWSGRQPATSFLDIIVVQKTLRITTPFLTNPLH
ncbi:class I SAM-dependent methyltransferase [Spirosoma flavum]|uniref:Methyltransferase domain-containing protein n=1 Tax=Spirosoma flavum TaxID=2048557 RepID=A0ABW6ADJ3_9BACT